jgi:hypothetical protein
LYSQCLRNIYTSPCCRDEDISRLDPTFSQREPILCLSLMTHSDNDFYASDSDIFLLSSDDIEFCVHRCILSAASPFFEYMFALPRPPADPGNEERRAVIPMLEPGSTLQQLLHFVYSVPHPTISSLDELATILGVAVKYDCFLAPSPRFARSLYPPHFWKTIQRECLQSQADMTSSLNLK